MNDLCEKMEGKTNFLEAPETDCWLVLADHSPPPYFMTAIRHISLQCFDTVCLTTGRACKKTGCWFVVGDDLIGALHDF